MTARVARDHCSHCGNRPDLREICVKNLTLLGAAKQVISRALTIARSFAKQEREQRRRLVQFRPVMAAGSGAAGAQVLEQDDLRVALELAVAAGKLDRIGARRNQRILIAVNMQYLRSGLGKR